MELQGAAQVGARAAIGMVPSGGQGGQFPDGVDVAGPAVPQLIAAVVAAEHGISPLPQLVQLRRVGLAVQADPTWGGGTAGCGGVQCVGRCLGEFLEASGEIQIADNPGAVEPLAEPRDLAAQGGDLRGQGSQAFAESLHG